MNLSTQEAWVYTSLYTEIEELVWSDTSNLEKTLLLSQYVVDALKNSRRSYVSKIAARGSDWPTNSGCWVSRVALATPHLTPSSSSVGEQLSHLSHPEVFLEVLDEHPELFATRVPEYDNKYVRVLSEVRGRVYSSDPVMYNKLVFTLAGEDIPNLAFSHVPDLDYPNLERRCPTPTSATTIILARAVCARRYECT